MALTAVKIHNLDFTYPSGTAALQHVSLEIIQGEKVAILGGNGAGKSTLLLHFNGILRGEGKVLIYGLEPVSKNLREIRKKVGIVFQNPDDQLFCPTVHDDVAFGPLNMGLDKGDVDKHVQKALTDTGINDLADRNSFQLSFGEKKRAAIATVLSMNPDLIALDEPTSNLDPSGVRELAELLNRIERTLIVITHNIEFATQTCDRFIVMKDGEIKKDGTPSDVLADQELLTSCGLL